MTPAATDPGLCLDSYPSVLMTRPDADNHATIGCALCPNITFQRGSDFMAHVLAQHKRADLECARCTKYARVEGSKWCVACERICAPKPQDQLKLTRRSNAESERVFLSRKALRDIGLEDPGAQVDANIVDADTTPEEAEDEVEHRIAQKKCLTCRTAFWPTGGRQARCDDCRNTSSRSPPAGELPQASKNTEGCVMPRAYKRKTKEAPAPADDASKDEFVSELANIGKVIDAYTALSEAGQDYVAKRLRLGQ